MRSADDSDDVPDELRPNIRHATEALHMSALSEARRCIRENPGEMPAILTYRCRIVFNDRTATILEPELVQTKVGTPPGRSFLDCLQAVVCRENSVALPTSTRRYETVSEILVPTKFTNDDESGIKLLLRELQESQRNDRER
jgi:hypothetical protein